MENVPTRRVVAEVADDTEQLARLHVGLAKAETIELAVLNMLAAAMIGTAVPLLAVGVFIGVPLVAVLAIPSHLVVAVVWICAYGLGGALFLVFGIRMLRRRPRLPQRTIASIKETFKWSTTRWNLWS